MQYWIMITSLENFQQDREKLGFKVIGLSYRFRNQLKKMLIGDRVIYYIKKIHKFGAITTITGEYFEDYSKLWLDDVEIRPVRRHSIPNIILNDNELIDIKTLLNNLRFIKKKDIWGTYVQGSIKIIQEEDFEFIEYEMKKVISNKPNM